MTRVVSHTGVTIARMTPVAKPETGFREGGEKSLILSGTVARAAPAPAVHRIAPGVTSASDGAGLAAP